MGHSVVRACVSLVVFVFGGFLTCIYLIEGREERWDGTSPVHQ